ncbi:hypothetical protein [Sphingomonas glacialis]|uniref:hypothetical protein n=1 Tax=Sphingomonas glacialis TaxID=658225 RepID=UPI0016728826|nr:hypothetical protein [Sphingomonas glacialis]
MPPIEINNWNDWQGLGSEKGAANGRLWVFVAAFPPRMWCFAALDRPAEADRIATVFGPHQNLVPLEFVVRAPPDASDLRARCCRCLSADALFKFVGSVPRCAQLLDIVDHCLWLIWLIQMGSAFAKICGRGGDALETPSETNLKLGLMAPNPMRQTKRRLGADRTNITQDYVDTQRGFAQSRDRFVSRGSFYNGVATMSQVVSNHVP